MHYYKLFTDSKFIGVSNSFELYRYQLKHFILLLCDIDKAQYIKFKDKYYHTSWFQPINNNEIEYEEIFIQEIDEKEYNYLNSFIENDEEISYNEAMRIEEPEPPIEEVIEDVRNGQYDENTIEFIKEAMISRLSKECNEIITAGFDLELSDNKKHHFSLTAQDQLNLLNISIQIDNNEKNFIYHADGEEYKVFSTPDMKKIIQSANNFKLYHTTYFNCLKFYLNSLAKIEQIKQIVYGIDIPEEFQTDVFKMLNN